MTTPVGESPDRLGSSVDVAIAAAILAVAAGSAYLVVQRMMNMTDMANGLFDFIQTWVLMMAAMMLPSALPAILGGARSDTRATGGAVVALHTVEFVVTYLAFWTAFGLVAYIATHWGPQAWIQAGRLPTAAVLVGAGAYELLPLKRGELQRCRAAVHGIGFVDGLRYGGACIVSSSALMLALLLLAPNSLAWMAVVAVVILFEKTAPASFWLIASVGLGLFVLAAAVALGMV